MMYTRIAYYTSFDLNSHTRPLPHMSLVLSPLLLPPHFFFFSNPNKQQSKMLKCAGNEDIITMKADDTGDVVTFMFESPGELVSPRAAVSHTHT